MNKTRIGCYIVVVLLLGFSDSVLSQTDISAPVLKNASVINEDGDVRLTWELTDTINSSIIIARDSLDINAFTRIHLITDTSTKSWIDRYSKANNRSRAYKLAYDLEGLGSPSSNEFNTIHTEPDFDICEKKIQLTWTRDVKSPTPEWMNFFNIIQYLLYDQTFIHLIPSRSLVFNNDTTTKMSSWNIYRSKDGEDYKKIDNIEDTVYIDNKIEYNHIYKYYIEGVQQADTSVKTKSNRVMVNTRMPKPPSSIRFKSLSSQENENTLSFEISEDSEQENYILLRKTSQEYYDTVNTFKTNNNEITYTDERVNNQKEKYFYHLASVNPCGALTTRSDTLSTLQLKVEKQNLNNVLEWNTMKNIPGSTIRYNIYRKIGEEGNFEPLATTHQGSYTDNQVQNFRGQGKSAQFCYFLEAEIDHQSGRQSVVSSETQCLYIKPRIFIPNAIIPNDPNNRNFKPEFTFIPKNYLLIVYNRNGAKVFESNDPQKPWRGKIRGGKRAPGGTYIYYLEVKNPGQQIIRRKGEVTVVYQK